MICTCAEHKDTEPPTSTIDGCVYTLVTQDVKCDDELTLTKWRWTCMCGSRGGRYTFQSPNVPYHSWLDHAARQASRRFVP